MDELVEWLKQYSAGVSKLYRDQIISLELAVNKQEVLREVLDWIEEHKDKNPGEGK